MASSLSTRPHWSKNAIFAGAVTIMRNDALSQGLLSSVNSVLGTTIGAGFRLNVTHDRLLDRAVVGRPADKLVTFRAFSLFADGFGVTGILARYSSELRR